MASVYRRKPDGKWYACWKGADGRHRSRVAYTDKKKSRQLAERLETEAGEERDGLVPAATTALKEAALRPVPDHVEDYRLALVAKGDTPGHVRNVVSALSRLLGDGGVRRLSDLTADRLQAALGRLRARRSPRTANHALGAAKAFAKWLAEGGRVAHNPLRGLRPYSQKVDRRRERRALDLPAVARLLEAAESAPSVVLSRRGRDRREMAGPERAMLYRLACETGFRADELRSLTRDSFRLDGPAPAVVVEAAYTKNGERAVQPIRAAFAERLRAWLPGRPAVGPVLPVPVRTAQLLRRDLEAAGIPYRDGKGRVVDFHALRATFITNLIRSGANPKVVQKLARHSTITLTLDLYTHLDDGDLRAALEGGEDDA